MSRILLYSTFLVLITITALTNVGTTLSCACMGKVEGQTLSRYTSNAYHGYVGYPRPSRRESAETNVHTRVFQWNQEAADQGDARALYRLGSMYEQGLGVRKDFSQAVLSYKVAAANGVPEAQYNLGVMYANGRGVPRDFAEAHRLFSMAATDLVDARFNLAVMYERGYGVPQAYSEAIKWYRAAAEDDPGAQYALGVIYAQGRNGPKDYVQALSWFRRAAYAGHAEAQYRLGVIHDNGMLGVARNVEKAAEWFLLAAESGHAQAQRSIGLMYQTGRGVPQDERTADRWLKRWEDAQSTGARG